MAIKVYKPTINSRRNMSVIDYSSLSKVAPEKSLLAPLNKKAGRNSYGRITVRHRGGGNRRKYRIIDFKRNKFDVEAIVKTIEYDPNRSAFIALIEYTDGEKAYILAPEGLKVGYKVVSGENAGALSRQRRSARPFRRQHGAAHGERERLRAAQTSLQRAEKRSRNLHGDHRSGFQPRPLQREDR